MLRLHRDDAPLSFPNSPGRARTDPAAAALPATLPLPRSPAPPLTALPS